MKVGLQLFSVKEHMVRDCSGTMRAIRNMGYKYIEPFFSSSYPLGEGEKGYGLGMSRLEARNFLSETGLRLAGTHYGSPGRDDFEGMCDYFRFLGSDNIGTGGRFFPRGKDDVMECIELMTKDAETASEYGLRYYYHTHYWEFQEYDGKTALELMLENTDSDKVFFEIDNYWAVRGGADPVALTKSLGSRQIMMHQNDLRDGISENINLFEGLMDFNVPVTREIHASNSRADTFAEVGTGVLPIQSYIDEGNKNGVEFAIIEMDFTTIDEMESVKISYDAFHKFSGIEWD